MSGPYLERKWRTTTWNVSPQQKYNIRSIQKTNKNKEKLKMLITEEYSVVMESKCDWEIPFLQQSLATT